MDAKRLAAMKRVREFRRTLALAEVMAQERALQGAQAVLRDAKEAYERDQARYAAAEARLVERSRTERLTPNDIAAADQQRSDWRAAAQRHLQHITAAIEQVQAAQAELQQRRHGLRVADAGLRKAELAQDRARMRQLQRSEHLDELAAEEKVWTPKR
jgi:hypothetical protein